MLESYKEAERMIAEAKSEIITKLVGHLPKEKKMESGKLYFAMFSDITDSWCPKDIYRNSISEIKHCNVKQLSDELASIKINIERSKDLIATLSKMLQFKNVSAEGERRNKYFIKLSESTLDMIAEILGDNFAPKDIRETHNISSDIRTASREDVFNKNMRLLNEAKERIKRVNKK